MLVILDVLIGLAFIYGLFSVLVSAATELLLTLWSQRGKTLWKAVQGLLPADASCEKSNVVTRFIKHPLITGLGAAQRDPADKSAGLFGLVADLWARLKGVPNRAGVRTSFPSYLPKHVFVDTLMHLLRSGSIRQGNESAQAELADLIGDVASEPMRTTLQALHQSSQEMGVTFRARLELWFSDAMDRASGWYKRVSQLVMIAVAFVMAAWCNVDTLRIVAVLSGNKELRKSVAESASDYLSTQLKNVATLNDPTPRPPVLTLPVTTLPGDTQTPALSSAATPSTADGVEQKIAAFNTTLKQMDTLGLPIGWGKAEVIYAFSAWPLVLIGWLMSALAATLGANFWFQILGSLLKLRITGAKPEEATPNSSATATTAAQPQAALQTQSAYDASLALQSAPPPAGYGLEAPPQEDAAHTHPELLHGISNERLDISLAQFP